MINYIQINKLSERCVVARFIDKMGLSANLQRQTLFIVVIPVTKPWDKRDDLIYYEMAVTHYQPSLTVIHGVGEGVLKNEIHQLLKSRKVVSRFDNRYHPLYGYGATEIYFQY